jgi:hypothetical protein
VSHGSDLPPDDLGLTGNRSAMQLLHREECHMNPVIYRLKLIHSRLESEVRRELKARFPDHGRVKRLKKLKLAIKDQLSKSAPRAARAG